MTERNLRRVDLNLLVALDMLLRERHVTRAGARLGLSQPGISRVLERLRQTFGDPLLVKTGAGMTPTPRALALAGPLRDVLAGAAGLVWPQAFTPAAATGTVRVFATDAIAETALAPWVARIAAAAPQLNFRILAMPERVEEALARGEADFAVDVYPVAPPGCQVRQLYHDRFVCLVRRGHPLLPGRLTAKRYAALRHIAITGTSGGGAFLDRELARRGVARDVVLRSPHFATAPAMLLDTDWVLTIPGSRARQSAARLPLVVLPLPFSLPPIPLSLLWHEVADGDPLQAWLRGELVASVGKGDAA